MLSTTLPPPAGAPDLGLRGLQVFLPGRQPDVVVTGEPTGPRGVTDVRRPTGGERGRRPRAELGRGFADVLDVDLEPHRLPPRVTRSVGNVTVVPWGRGVFQPAGWDGNFGSRR